MNTDQVIKAISNTELFKDVPEEFLRRQMPEPDVRNFEKDELIIRKSEFGDSLFIILSGSVKVHDEKIVVASLNTGEIFGEMAFLDPGSRSMSISALEPTVVVNIPREVLHQLFQDFPESERYVISTVVQRLRDVDKRLNPDQPGKS